MDHIVNCENCFGCRSCEQVCPVKAITIAPDVSGFLVPTVDESKCIKCGKCVRSCPIYVENKQREPVDCLAFQSKDKDGLKQSASGGFSYHLSKYVVKKGGIVYGCAFDDGFVAKHIRIDKPEDLWKIQGSKYVQSDTNDSFSRVKEDLSNDRLVLFTGTPCQVAGLKAFLGKDYENLITMDIVCHGVPSPKLFKHYIKSREATYKSKVTSFSFRSKKRGWGRCILSMHFANGQKVLKVLIAEEYGRDFFSCNYFRECCYSCPFSSDKRVGDFTGADLWGGESPKWIRGASLVLVNSEKAKKLLENGLADDAIIEKYPLNDAIKAQGNLQHPSLRTIPDAYKDLDFETHYSNKKARPPFKKRVRYAIPTRTRLFIKATLRKIRK